MSTPRNHHYVSQIHLKQFFNTKNNCIYVYDKKRKNHYTKKTTKSLFSEKDLNTRFVENKKDFITLENELNENFEKNFKTNLIIIERLIESLQLTPENKKSLYYFAKYGIIGDIRTPRHKKAIDDTMWNSFKNIIPMCETNLKKQMEEMFAYKSETKYSNTIDYTEISELILSAMGNLIFKIILPESKNDYFVIPDCSSITMRDTLNHPFNPDIKEIAYIGLPISSKIYIHFFSKKLFKESIPKSDVVFENSTVINKINMASLKVCESKIACENNEYLKKFIKNSENKTFV